MGIRLSYEIQDEAIVLKSQKSQIPDVTPANNTTRDVVLEMNNNINHLVNMEVAQESLEKVIARQATEIDEKAKVITELKATLGNIQERLTRIRNHSLNTVSLLNEEIGDELPF